MVTVLGSTFLLTVPAVAAVGAVAAMAVRLRRSACRRAVEVVARDDRLCPLACCRGAEVVVASVQGQGRRGRRVG